MYEKDGQWMIEPFVKHSWLYNIEEDLAHIIEHNSLKRQHSAHPRREN
jgi:hypothetical protein